MWEGAPIVDEPVLKSFIAEFIAAIARYQRLMDRHVYPPFEDIDRAAREEAQPIHNEWEARRFEDPEDYDEGESAEHLERVGQRIYDNLFSMQTALVNLFTAGLYHSLEQQLSAMLLHDGQPLPQHPKPAFAAWATTALQIDVTTYPHWPQLDELRLIANVVKHAEGNAAQQLRALRPELFEHPLLRDPIYAGIPPAQLPVRHPLAGEGLYLIKDDFDAYVAAISGFWEWLSQVC